MSFVKLRDFEEVMIAEKMTSDIFVAFRMMVEGKDEKLLKTVLFND
jgi:hypothetical protein